MKVQDFHNLHRGETCLIAGVGPNLNMTPPERFDLPSFSVNTIFRYAGWKPTYYVGVDERLRLENGSEIMEKYPDIPKFFPSPDWDELEGKNIVRFKHAPRADLAIPGASPAHPKALSDIGISYRRVMDAVFQIAIYMGFETALMIGVQHKPNEGNDEDRAHFWGVDVQAVPDQPPTWWFDGYKYFARLSPLKVLNISADTYVPEDILPRDDWRKYVNH